MPQKEIKEKIIEILAILKWGKMFYDDSCKIMTTCSNGLFGINPCCSSCPACDCHKEVEKFAEQISKLLAQEYKNGYNQAIKDFKIPNKFGEKSL